MADTIDAIVRKVQEAHRRGMPLKKIRSGTHSTKPSDTQPEAVYVDLRGLDRVLSMTNRYAWVQPGITMRNLVAATLQEGKIPQVVPEFPTITAGGAVHTALESTSWQFGQYDNTLLEYRVLTGEGALHTLTPGKDAIAFPDGRMSVRYNDFFDAYKGSFGSLGIMTDLKIALRDAKQYVQLRYHHFTDIEDSVAFIEKKTLQTRDIDFIEGIMYGPEDIIIISGILADTIEGPLQTFSLPDDSWFHQHAYQSQNAGIVTVPIEDYLFRYDRGAFWMGEFVLDHFPARLRPRIQRALDPILNEAELYRWLHEIKTIQSYILQDMYAPIENTAAFLRDLDDTFGIYPVWLCPVRPTTRPQKFSPHYAEGNSSMFIDVGLWGRPVDDGVKRHADPTEDNSQLIRLLRKHDVRRMGYAESLGEGDPFLERIDKDWYSHWRNYTQAEPVFADFFDKVGTQHDMEPDRLRGTLRYLLSRLV